MGGILKNSLWLACVCRCYTHQTRQWAVTVDPSAPTAEHVLGNSYQIDAMRYKYLSDDGWISLLNFRHAKQLLDLQLST